MGRWPLGAQTRRKIGFSPMRCSSVAQTSIGVSGCERHPIHFNVTIRLARSRSKLDCKNTSGLDARMRTLAVASIALLTSLSARADAPSPPIALKPAPPKVQPPSPAALPTDVQQLRDRWMQCTAAAAKTDLRSSRPAEVVADAALQRCRAQEQPLSHALNRQLGKDGAVRVLEQIWETDRSNLI